MKRRAGVVSVLAAFAWAGGAMPGSAHAQAPAVPAAPVAPSMPPIADPPTRPPAPEMKPLGHDRYQIGRIVVDRRAGSFTVPGRVHKKNMPLEYIATSPRGMKEYEALLELPASGSEFNLACILIGLEADPKLPWRELRIAKRIPGPRVALRVAWEEAGKRVQMSAAEALLNPEAGVAAATVEWVYIGSPNSEAVQRFAADDTGTLIGFVSDANSIIESATPIGVGAYGSVRGNAKLPPAGTPIELIVQAVKPAK